MVISFMKIDEKSIIESTNEIFGFYPKVEIFFTHGKDSLRQNEKLMMKVISEIIPKVLGDAVMGFTQSNRPFLQKKENELLIDESWRDIIFPSSLVSIKNMGLPHRISKLSDF